MQLSKVFLKLSFVAVLLYGFYSFLLAKKIHETSDISTKIAKERFLKTSLNDTITRIEKIYHDNCNYSFWIQNYSMDHVVVNICKYPILKQLNTGDLIVKNANSNECIFIKADGSKTKLLLQIEY